MGAVAFIQLQRAFSPEQVEALANFMDTQAATKADLAEAKSELKAELAEAKSELKAELAEVRSELAEVRSELKADIAEVRSDVRLLEQRLVQIEQRMTIKLGTMLFLLAGAIIAAIRYLPSAH